MDIAFDKQHEEGFYQSLTDKERIDTLILPYLMYHGIHAMRKKNVDFREDVMRYLQQSVEASLTTVTSEGMRIKYAKEASDAAKHILDSMNPDSDVQAIKAAALMIVCMAEQELLVDVSSQAVLAAMLVVQQAQEENHSGVWGSWNDSELREMINRGLNSAQLRGHL